MVGVLAKADVFAKLIETVEDESIRVFNSLEIGPDGIDWEGSGLQAPSSTWTYTINDDVVKSNVFRDLAYNPMLLLGAAWMIPILFLFGLWQRLKRRKPGDL